MILPLFPGQVAVNAPQASGANSDTLDIQGERITAEIRTAASAENMEVLALVVARWKPLGLALRLSPGL